MFHIWFDASSDFQLINLFCFWLSSLQLVVFFALFLCAIETSLRLEFCIQCSSLFPSTTSLSGILNGIISLTHGFRAWACTKRFFTFDLCKIRLIEVGVPTYPFFKHYLPCHFNPSPGVWHRNTCVLYRVVSLFNAWSFTSSHKVIIIYVCHVCIAWKSLLN